MHILIHLIFIHLSSSFIHSPWYATANGAEVAQVPCLPRTSWNARALHLRKQSTAYAKPVHIPSRPANRNRSCLNTRMWLRNKRQVSKCRQADSYWDCICVQVMFFMRISVDTDQSERRIYVIRILQFGCMENRWLLHSWEQWLDRVASVNKLTF